MAKKDPMVRFWAKVNKTSTCWLWTASVDITGYGKFAHIPGKWRRAHLWLYEQVVGPVPPGYVLLHECDVHACVRLDPKHVHVGTQSRNMKDSYARGRSTTRGVRDAVTGRFTKEVQDR